MDSKISLPEVSHGAAKMRGGSLSLLSFLPRRERPLLAGKNRGTRTDVGKEGIVTVFGSILGVFNKKK